MTTIILNKTDKVLELISYDKHGGTKNGCGIERKMKL